MLEDLRGVFFIVKGQYRSGVAPSFYNTCVDSEQWLGGYNPETTTTEWYQLIDRLTWTVHYANSEYEKVLAGVRYMIKKYKTRSHFLSVMTEFGARNSSSVREMDRHIYDLWGDYFLEDIEEEEGVAYAYLKENSTYHKVARRMKGKVLHDEVEVVAPEVVGGVEKRRKPLKLKKMLRAG